MRHNQHLVDSLRDSVDEDDAVPVDVADEELDELELDVALLEDDCVRVLVLLELDVVVEVEDRVEELDRVLEAA